MININDKLVKQIIQKSMFHHVFQPLYILEDWKVFGYEALLRCKFFQNHEILFKLAKDKKSLYDLDSSSIYHALSAVNFLDKSLFVNVYPSTIVHPSFREFLGKLKSNFLSIPKIVFEINETEKILDMDLMKKAVQNLKDYGYSVALDDYGRGQSSIDTVHQLDLDFIKLDRYYSIDLSRSKKKQNVIEMLLNICHRKNMILILEGIEEPEDLAIAKALGVHVGQGYLLDKPMSINEIKYKKG